MNSGIGDTSWPGEHWAEIERMLQGVIERTRSETPLRLPRGEAERRNRFAAWLDHYRQRWLPALGGEIRPRQPALLVEGEDEAAVQRFLEEEVWPEVEEFLRRFAVRGLAAAWVTGRLGDGLTLGWPEPSGDGWRVRLADSRSGQQLGQVVLDMEGNILTDRTTTRESILETSDGSARPAPATAARQQ
jgi:hypothetical protein